MMKTVKNTYRGFEERLKLVNEGYYFAIEYNRREEDDWYSPCKTTKVDINAYTDYDNAVDFYYSLEDEYAIFYNLNEDKLRAIKEEKKREKSFKASQRMQEREYAKKNVVFQEKIKELNMTEEEFLEMTKMAEDKVREARRLLKNAYANLQFYYDIEDYRRIAKNLK